VTLLLDEAVRLSVHAPTLVRNKNVF
jgi:hypothetical protein